MNPSRFETHASAVLMVLAWLLITGLLALHFTIGLFTKTTPGRLLLLALVLSWLLIPIQVVRYYRRNKHDL
jgi:hypothetical protein